MARRRINLPTMQEALDIAEGFRFDPDHRDYKRLAVSTGYSEEAIRKAIFVCRVIAHGFPRRDIPLNLERPLVDALLEALR